MPIKNNMQIVMSIFLDLKLVNIQNTRFVAFMHREIIFEFYLWKENFFYEKFQIRKMNFVIKIQIWFFFLNNREWIFWKVPKSDFLIK